MATKVFLSEDGGGLVACSDQVGSGKAGDGRRRSEDNADSRVGSRIHGLRQTYPSRLRLGFRGPFALSLPLPHQLEADDRGGSSGARGSEGAQDGPWDAGSCHRWERLLAGATPSGGSYL